MNTTQQPHGSDLERQLGALLHDRLDPIRASVELTDPVVNRSRRIQRNRALAGGAAIALAAVAVAGPLTWAALRGGPNHSLPPAATSGSTVTSSASAPTTSPSPTTPTSPTSPTTTASQPSATTPVTIPTHTIPAGAAKTVSAGTAWAAGSTDHFVWTVGKVVHRDGRSASLPVGTDWQFVPLAEGNGLVIDGAFEKDRTVSLVGPDGAVVRKLVTVPGAYSNITTAASADGATVALYATKPAEDKVNDGLIFAWDARGKELARKDNLVHTAHLAGWYGGRVFLGNYTSTHSYVWDLGTNIIDNYYNGGSFGTVNAEGFAAAFTPIGEGFTGCTEILDVRGAQPQPLSTHCGDFQAYGPAALSPDGRYLAGSNAYQDGFGPGLIRVLDTDTGRVALEVTNGAFLSYGFASDGSLAIDVLKGFGSGGPLSQVIARCTLDGACTRVTDEVAAQDEMEPPMRLHLLTAR